MNLKSFAKASRQMLNRNASKILAGFAIGAGVMAVGFAIEATPKAMILLEEKKAELGAEKLDAKTIVKTAGPVYIPTVVSMGLSTVCTIGALKVKSQQKQRMQQASQRRMMQDVPKADVVITNPTHFAVAVKYDAQKNDAPVVVAKGQDYVAQKIKEIARDNNIHIVENKPLARMLFHNVDLGAEIPPELYRSVAEILAMIYKENN